MNAKIFIFLIGYFVPYISSVKAQESKPKESPRATDWFQDARFGMFIHFGLYSLPARGEWVRNAEKISNEDYQKYFEQFNPTDYNPKEWARLAKAAGMKYAVITAKHHEGFALFDSKLTDYKVTKTPFKRDIIKEYVEAFRAAGLKVGLYYSLIDWHHPDYPHYGDAFHPMRENAQYKGKKHNWDKYVDYMHGQVRELCTNYGKIDLMWFDFSYGPMVGEKWKARELVKMVRTLQPGILLNNRLAGNGGPSAGESADLGDFNTPEQGVPEAPLKDRNGKYLVWETCLTLNNNWGYHAEDDQWKSTATVLHALVNCVSKGGNLLLNVGPDAKGNIPAPSVEVLSEVGQWMSKNSRSIYGCGIADVPKPEWGRYTQNGKFLYAHLQQPTIGHLNLKGYQGKVKRATVLNTGKEAATESEWWGAAKNNENFFVNVQAPTYKTYKLPDTVDTVFEIELK